MVRRLLHIDTLPWQRLIALGTALALALPLAATWLGPSPWVLRIWSAALLALGVAQPRWGLLLVAGLSPVATPMALTIGAPFGGPQMIEAMTVPFVVGFALRTGVTRVEPPSPIVLPAAAMGAVILIGAVAQLVAAQETSAWAGDFYPALVRHLTIDYFADPATFVPAHLALIWITGLGFAAAASILVARDADVRRGVVDLLLIGAAAAACAVLQRLFEISARTSEPWQSALRFVVSTRINPHYPDLNAAGSYYAMFAVAAVWMALKTRSAIARLTLPFIVAGLWMSGSRTALGAAVVAIALLAARGRRWRPVPLALGVLAVIAAASIVMLNPGRQQAEAGEAVTIRAELVRVSFRLAARAPAFGIGLGEFQRASMSEIDPAVIRGFPAAARGENAHNNFLQIFVELGAVGLALFLWMSGLALRSAARVLRTSTDRRLAAAAAALGGGTTAFLLTCLAGHPLLTPQVLLPFLLVLGTLVGYDARTAEVSAPASASAPIRRRLAMAAVAIAVVIAAAALPWRIARHVSVIAADGASIGVSPTAGEVDGVRYRIIDGRARFWVPAATQAVELPLRLGADTACEVAIDVNGRRANVVRPSADNWNVVRLPLGQATDERARRLDVTTSPMDCRLMAGPLRRRE